MGLWELLFLSGLWLREGGGGVGWGVCGWMVGKCVNSDGLNSRLGCLDLSSYSYVQLSLWFPGF